VSEVVPRVIDLLVGMKRVSEAGAAQAYEERAGGNAADSEPPPGFNLETGSVHPDEESLLDQQLRELELWCIRAEHELAIRKYKSPANHERLEDDEQFAKRIEVEHRGRQDLEVALKEGCTLSAVDKARASLGLDERGLKPTQVESD
jgi:hypothetical protein